MSSIIFALAIYLLINNNKTIADSNKNLIKGGLVSGLLAGLVGTGGAIRGLTLSAFGLEKNIFIATSALIDLGVDTSRAVVYASNGYVRVELLATLPILIAVSFIGTWIGKLLLKTIPQNWFRKIVLGIILLTSSIQLFTHLIHWAK